jgi:hypothetical protein
MRLSQNILLLFLTALSHLHSYFRDLRLILLFECANFSPARFLGILKRGFEFLNPSRLFIQL